MTDEARPDWDKWRRKFRGLTTPTLAGVMLTMGLRNTFMTGVRPLVLGGVGMFGFARTLRFLPVRDDLVPLYEQINDSPDRRGLASAHRGDVFVYDVLGVASVGGPGNIVAAALAHSGATGMVVNGNVRDLAKLAEVGLPVYARGVHGAQGRELLMCIELDAWVTCGNVTVRTGDFLVGDGEGVVVVPPDRALNVCALAAEHQDREAFALKMIEGGEPLHTVYPLTDAYKDEFAEYVDDGEIPWRLAAKGPGT